MFDDHKTATKHIVQTMTFLPVRLVVEVPVSLWVRSPKRCRIGAYSLRYHQSGVDVQTTVSVGGCTQQVVYVSTCPGHMSSM